MKFFLTEKEMVLLCYISMKQLTFANGLFSDFLAKIDFCERLNIANLKEYPGNCPILWIKNLSKIFCM